MTTATATATATDYDRGYSIGLTWAEDWAPGGPYVPAEWAGRGTRRGRYADIRANAVAAAAAWHQGFNAARAAVTEA